MKCPECKQENHFRVSGWELDHYGRMYIQQDEGFFHIDETKDQECQEWGIYPDSFALCTECGHEEHLDKFQPNEKLLFIHEEPKHFSTAQDVKQIREQIWMALMIGPMCDVKERLEKVLKGIENGVFRVQEDGETARLPSQEMQRIPLADIGRENDTELLPDKE